MPGGLSAPRAGCHPQGTRVSHLHLPCDGVAMNDPRFLISYNVSHLGVYFTAHDILFWQS